jgi:hypothetical protein
MLYSPTHDSSNPTTIEREKFMKPNNYFTSSHRGALRDNACQPPKYESTEEDREAILIEIRERRVLLYSSIGLAVLGVFAFLVSGQVAVVIAMNAPLVAIIGKEFFRR